MAPYSTYVVCGNWAAHNEIPPGDNSFDSLTAVAEQNYIALKHILKGPYPSGSAAGWITVALTEDQAKADKENFAKMQNAYAACMNYEALEEEGLEYLAAFVKLVVDAFPATAESNKTSGVNYDHAAAMGKTLTIFEKLGFETTQKITPTQGFVDPEDFILQIDAPSDFYFPPMDDTREYLELAATLISAVHPAKITVKHAANLMISVLEWQQNLQKLVAAAQEADDSDSEAPPATKSLAEIQKLAPQLNYAYVVEQLAPKGYLAEEVTFQFSNYYKTLSELISQTPSEVLQAFFVWRSISSLSPYIESKPTNAYNDFILRQGGGDLKNRAPRWKTCVQSVAAKDAGMTWILSRFFLDKNYSPQARELTLDVVDTLKDAFIERVKTRDWATDEVKKAAIKKVEAILSKVVLPSDPDLIDPTNLYEYYADTEITSSYVGNVQALTAANVGKKWAALGEPFDRGQFRYSTLIVNAAYLPQSNAIELETGVQQFPIYDVAFPSYMIYGGMGSIVGHEITHGFDDTGRLFDLNGNMTKWWDQSSIDGFLENAECFVEQYGKFTITAPNGTQVPVDGVKTLGENIADAGGVTSSFAAWKKWENKKGKAKSLPGLEMFTHEQLFFLKWGQTWCENITPAAALAQVLGSDVHSPKNARIKLTLSNSAEFNKAFNCPKKEPVCELW
ncbi:hypothetical protein BGZ61DRAFT_538959 [Ilyonectria robusta]|uniref:uncharacterized protein n=1 Tax=Ilyonectria robusta TaxID=1079257 RepID=UPI001E8E8879|nr:uncharacterized protein BGZ61DRAFT_538959 [Ilyonectria robusta]KAH8664884.1 hypothetical protein BGZ61DRAFT_538959 [Ilyonectria robusta]